MKLKLIERAKASGVKLERRGSLKRIYIKWQSKLNQGKRVAKEREVKLVVALTSA